MKEVLLNITNKVLGYTVGFYDDLKENGVDSLTLVSLIVEIEDFYNITFSDSDLEPQNLKTLNIISNILKRYL